MGKHAQIYLHACRKIYGRIYTTKHLCVARGLCRNPLRKFILIPGLDINPPRASKPTYKSFSGLDARHFRLASLLYSITTVPSDKVPIVDDMLFVCLELSAMLV